MAAPTDPTSAPTKPFKVSANAPKISLTPPTVSEPPLNGPTSNPNAVSLANFINDAHSAGYGSMDPNIIATIGHQMGNNNNSKMALAVTKQPLSIANKASQFLFEQSATDPQVTPAKVVQDHIKSTGTPTLTPPQISSFQQQLKDAQANGAAGAYDPGLPANGIWNQDWQNALVQYQTDQRNKPGVGTFSAVGAFHTIFGEMWLNHAIPLLLGVAKAMGSTIAEGSASLLRGATNATTAISGALGNRTSAEEGAQYSLEIAHALDSIGRAIAGQKKVGTQAYINDPGSAHDLINIGNALLTISTMGTGTAIKEGLVMGVKEGVAAGKEFGATSAAKALFTKTAPIRPQGITNWIMNSVLPESGTGNRFIGTRWLQNVPAAQGLLNGLDKVATDVGGAVAKGKAGLAANKTATAINNAYKTARSTIATPYRYPIVGIGGNLIQDVGTAGMKIGVQGHTENWLHDPNGAQAQALDHLTPIAGILGQGLNVLQLFGHGPSYDSAGLPSEQIGKQVADIHNNLSDALNSQGIFSDYERGTNGNILKEKQAFADAGIPPEWRDAQISEKFTKFAANAAAKVLQKTAIQNGILDASNAEQRVRWLQNQQHAILHNPELRAKAIESYVGQPLQFAHDLENEMLISKESKSLAESVGLTKQAQMQMIIKNEILPYLGSEHIIIPDSGRTPDWFPKNNPTVLDAQNATLNSAPLASKIGLSLKGTLHAPDVQNQAMEYYKELEKARPGFIAPPKLSDAMSSNGKPISIYDSPNALPSSYNKDAVTPAEAELHDKLITQLANELGRNPRDMQLVPTQDLIMLQIEKSHWLPADVKLADSAPENLRNAFDKIDALGGKLNFGTDTGLVFTNPTLSSELLGSSRNFLSQVADKLGLNLAKARPEIGDAQGVLQMKKTLNDEILKKQAIDPMKLGSASTWATGSRLIEYGKDVIRPRYSGLAEQYMNLINIPVLGNAITLKPGVKGAWNKVIKDLIGTEQVGLNGITKTIENRLQAKDHILNTISASNAPQAWLKKDFMKSMTSKGTMDGKPNGAKPGKGEIGKLPTNRMNATGTPIMTNAIGMSTKDASDLWYAMQKGKNSAPAYSNGINLISKLMNSSFGLAGIPLAIKGHRILALTNPIQQALIKARYSYNPFQSWLRVDKSAIKGVNEDMPISFNPSASLAELPNADQALAKELANKIDPLSQDSKDSIDYTTKEFAGSDLGNIYNARATLERTAYYVAKKMASEGKDINSVAGFNEYKSRVSDIYDYGNRTAAEKTLNSIMFPFSFEKTVVRELGSKLVDSPSMRMMVAAAIGAYNSADGKKTRAWMEQNLPLFLEAEKLNPFYHGVGGGLVGGINRTPLSVGYNYLTSMYAGKTIPSFDNMSETQKLDTFVHMLMPKAIGSKASAVATLGLVPMFRDLANNILGYNPSNSNPPSLANGAIFSTAQALAWEAGSEFSKLAHGQITGHSNPDPWQVQDHLPYAAQQKQAWALRSQMLTAYASVFAAKNRTWPSSVPLPPNTKVDITSLNQLIHYIYPAYDPTKAFTYVAVKTQAIADQRFVMSKAHPDYLGWFDQFTKQSDKIQGYISKESLLPSYNEASVADAMGKMRDAASKIISVDPSFAAFYAKYYATKYGPLKGL